jgi:hypothetical protein
MDEPSVLDYLKSKVAPWKYPKVEIPQGEILPHEGLYAEGSHPHPTTGSMYQRDDIPDSELINHGEIDATIQKEIPGPVEPEPAYSPEEIPSIEKGLATPGQKTGWPWLALGALVLAVFAQYTLEPGPDRSWIPALVLYLCALCLAAWAYIRSDWRLSPYITIAFTEQALTVRTYPLLAGIILGIISFSTFSDNRFTAINLLLLTLSLVFLIWAFWVPGDSSTIKTERRETNKSPSQWTLNISAWTVVLLLAYTLIAFFRFYKLNQVPLEMNSDHAEKILDVIRVLDGQTMIFFPTNGGREALQFYLVGALYKFFNVDLVFMSLKIVTTLVGFLSLPFIYLLGKDLVSRRVGLLALLFAGVAYWPNVVSRVGLRLPFYTLFTAALLYLLLIGIRSGKRNYFILAGLALGLSFYGYSADRILPVLVLAAVVIFVIHQHTKQHRKQVIASTIILFIIAAVLFLPMLRYMVEDPNSFFFRTLTRMGALERPLPGPAWQIFLSNLGKALAMFFWDNGEIWPVSVPHRPALDIVSGALFGLSIPILFVRYLQKRTWLDLFWLVSIPILLLPSIMSLAFPAENPNLYRTSGVLVPVFLMIGITLDGLMSSISSRLGSMGSKIAWGLGVSLVALSALFSYNLVFDQYNNQYKLSAWNSSEMARVVGGFIETEGKVDNVWVMAYPHWVDTRLIGMITGYPTRNFVLSPEDLGTLPEDPGTKLFLIKPEDDTSISMLFDKYPAGWLEEYTSEVGTKNFLMYFVPPTMD